MRSYVLISSAPECDRGPCDSDRSGDDFEGNNLVKDPHELHSLVYSGTAGIAGFRRAGQALFDDLYPQLLSLCDPLPPGYLPF